MSITRKLLKGMGLTDEQQDTILEAHTETISEIKAERDRYKADAEKLPDVQRQLDDMKTAGNGGYKEKYEKEHKAFEDFKADQTAKETHTAKEKAMRDILKEIGISEKRLDSVLKLCDIDGVELTEKGDVKGKDKLAATLKEDWADFIVTDSTQGANTANPPAAGSNAKMSKEDIFKIKDSGERQAAIAANHELFGF